MRYFRRYVLSALVVWVCSNCVALSAEHISLRFGQIERQSTIKLNGRKLSLELWDLSRIAFSEANESKTELTKIFQTLNPGLVAANVSTKAFMLYDISGQLVAIATWQDGAALTSMPEERILNKMAVKEAFWGERAIALSALTARLMRASNVPLKIADPVQVFGTSALETDTLRKTMRSQFAIAWSSVSMALANMIILNSCTFVGAAGSDF